MSIGRRGRIRSRQWWDSAYAGDARTGTVTSPAVPFSQYSDTLNKIRFSIADTIGRSTRVPC